MPTWSGHDEKVYAAHTGRADIYSRHIKCHKPMVGVSLQEAYRKSLTVEGLTIGHRDGSGVTYSSESDMLKSVS